MRKVKISVSVNSIYFSFTNQNKVEQINQTSYIETGNLTFEYDYLTNNTKIVSALIKDITNQTKINTIKIKNLELVPVSLKIIKSNPDIKRIYILDNKIIDTNSFLTLVDNKHLEYLNCFNMPSAMFIYLNQRKNILIELRQEINFTSDFMAENKLKQYSTIFYKKAVTISHELTNQDLIDLEAFLLINNNLQTINLKKYSLNQINLLQNLLIKYKKTKVRINIYQNDNNLDEIFKDINELKKLKKKQFNIKVIYNKDYIFKNFFKQINLSLLRYSFFIIFIALIIAFSITRYTNFKEDNETTEIVNEIQDILYEEETEENDDLSIEEIDDDIEDTTEKKKKSSKPNAYQKSYEKVFTKLKEINEDTIGWLTVKNTKVDYPVVQYSDNDYYLKHSFDKKYNTRGWIYADYRNNFDDLNDNTIIYGHNLKSGYMFGTLQKVLAESWYTNKDNLTITFNTINANYNWQIFSIYTMEKSNDYLVSTFANETNFNNYIKLSKEKSIVDFNVDVKYGDNILTLSTCYKDSNHRLIIQAKLIK